MKSIQSKVLLIIFSSIISISLLIGFLSVKLLHDKQNESNLENMENICQIKKEELNNVLMSIEQSVTTISNIALEYIHDLSLFENDSLYNNYISNIESIFSNISNNTQGTVAFYYRISPELRDSVSGFFWSGYNGKFNKEPNTDLNEYDENDIEHVGWYYIPKANGEPLWLMPYKNLNIDIYMISYVIPIYYDDVFVGVIGMDVDFNILTQSLDLDKKYDSGYFTLVDDDNIVFYENNIEDEQVNKSDKYIQTDTILLNKMKLVLSVNENEILEEERKLIITITITTLLLLLIYIFVTFIFTYNVIQPLKELTNATKKVLNGDYNININSSSNDEVGILAESFNTTIKIIQEKMDYIKTLAFKDSLTSVMSYASYKLEVERINKSLNKDSVLYAFVFDINDLKIVNDKYGHEFGNKIIIAASNVIAMTFNYLSTYRIGGDEFVVIIENQTDEQVNSLIEIYNILIKNCNVEFLDHQLNIEIAFGYTKYDPNTDSCFEDVFNRADSIMYGVKKELKENK